MCVCVKERVVETKAVCQKDGDEPNEREKTKEKDRQTERKKEIKDGWNFYVP